STASATAQPSSDGTGKAEKSAARKQNNHHQQRTEDQFPLLGDAAQYFFDEKIARSADDCPMQAANSAEQNHDDQFARPLPRHVSRAHELRRIGEQESGEPADCAGDDVSNALKAKDIEAQRSHSRRVLACGAKHSPEARIDDDAEQKVGKQKAEQNE